MLVLSRKKNESIVINNDIVITIVEIRGDKVRLGIEAPKDVPVHRMEVYEAIHGQLGRRAAVKVLHNALITRFPEVTQDDSSNTTTVLRASDQVAHVMDALYLLAGGGGAASKSSETPPAGRAERAHAVAVWVRDPLNSTPLDTRWIAPPDGTSTRRWVSTIAQAYTNGAAS